MPELLPRSTAEAENVSSPEFLRFVREMEKLDSIHSLMVMRHGRVIAEGWKKPYAPEVPHMLFSLSKSFTSIAVGLAEAEGLLSLDDRLVDLFADKLPAMMDPKFESMRLRHLLCMSSGHDHCAMEDMVDKPDWERAFFESSLAWEPGSRFCYNSGASYMLAAAVVRTSLTGLQDFLRPRLLDPLGIAQRYWQRSPQGIEVGGWGFNVTTEEIAVFAECLRNHGTHHGRQLIPPAYLAAAISVQADNSMNDQPDWRVGYGYQFWNCRHGAFRGDGAFGQYAIVMPEQEMTLAITSGMRNMQSILDLVWDILLPAVDRSCTEFTDVNAELSKWAMPVLSSKGRGMTEKVFRLEENQLGFQSLTFTSFDDRVELGLDGETLTAGFGCQKESVLTWSEPIPRRMAASARWNSENEVEILISLYETPFQWRCLLEFVGDGVTMRNESNLYFRTEPWPLLKGKLQL